MPTQSQIITVHLKNLEAPGTSQSLRMSVLQDPGETGLHTEMVSECESKVKAQSENQSHTSPLIQTIGLPMCTTAIIRECQWELGQHLVGYVASWQSNGAAWVSRSPGSQSFRTLDRIRAT